MYCENCGKLIEEGNKFCPYCGTKLVGTEEKVEEEIISMVNEGNEQGLIHDDEVEMITNIFEFSEKEVRDVMTPRSDVVGIDKHTTMDETIKIMLENNYSRYPVFDDDLDNIVGILYFKDFVKAYLQDKNQTIEQIMVEPTFVHPTKNISELFKRMQKEKIHMVIVVDEYGQTEGIIAMEDILEEIVGEIHDEYDEKEDDMFRQISEQEYIIEGSMNLDDINDRLETDLVSEDYDSLGGFIIEHLDRLPEVGDEVCTDNGIRLIVEALDKNRVESVRMYLPEKHDADNKSELSSSESAAQTAFTEEK